MTPKQAQKELDKMIDLTCKLGEYAVFASQKNWNSSDVKWVYMNVMINMSNKLKEVKKVLK